MTNQKRTNIYHKANLECAAIIIERPDLYPGLMQQWAQMVLKRTGTSVERDVGPLFRTSNLRESHIDEVERTES